MKLTNLFKNNSSLVVERLLSLLSTSVATTNHKLGVKFDKDFMNNLRFDNVEGCEVLIDCPTSGDKHGTYYRFVFYYKATNSFYETSYYVCRTGWEWNELEEKDTKVVCYEVQPKIETIIEFV